MDKKDNLSVLPKGWIWTKLDDICFIGAGNPAPQGKEYFTNGTHSFVRVQDMGRMGNNIYIHDTHDHINNKAIAKMKLLPKGSVLFTKSGMSILLNQRAILGREMYVVSHIGYSIPMYNISSEWIYYWLRKINFKDLTHATTLPSLQLSKVNNIDVPIAPLPEQQRIVDKIEELLSRLDKGIESLKTAQQQLKVYRQAVLKWAFEGKLTISTHRHFDKLSAQTSALRQAQGPKTVAEHKSVAEPVEATDKDGELPKGDALSLPNGWKWVKLDGICKIIGGVTKGRDFKGKHTILLPYLRVANVQDGYLDLKQIKMIEALPTDKEKYGLKLGDILYTEGGDKDKLGRGTIWRNEIEGCIHQNHIFRARPLSKDINSSYLAYFSQSQLAKNYFFKHGKQTTNLASINLTILSNLPIPICSTEEQHAIVAEIESRLSVCDKIEESIEQSLRQGESLRQSILKKAFEGKLVPQDPNDEPASKLLEGIKAEKEKTAIKRRSLNSL